MIITTSNILLGATPTVTTGASTDLPANLTDPDFSTVYVSSSATHLTYDFGQLQSINYVAVAGINIGDGEFPTIAEHSRVRVFDGGTLIKTNNVIRDNCVVLYFNDRTFTNLRVGLRSASGKNPICTFTAAGQAFEVPNSGEHAGYNRQFLNRSIKQKTTTNTLAAPVGVLTKRIPAKGSLPLPKMTKDFTEQIWQNFLDFAVSNYFFIQEQTNLESNINQDINSSAYLCYEVKVNKVSANAQTRQLNDISLTFSVYNGL